MLQRPYLDIRKIRFKLHLPHNRSIIHRNARAMTANVTHDKIYSTTHRFPLIAVGVILYPVSRSRINLSDVRIRIQFFQTVLSDRPLLLVVFLFTNALAGNTANTAGARTDGQCKNRTTHSLYVD